MCVQAVIQEIVTHSQIIVLLKPGVVLRFKSFDLLECEEFWCILLFCCQLPGAL